MNLNCKYTEQECKTSTQAALGDFMEKIRRAILGWASSNQLRRHILSGRGDVAALNSRIDQIQHQVTALQGFLEIAMKTTGEVNQFRSRMDSMEQNIAALKALLSSE
jgi:polyhydroxyalkanoate synthesis regulator phasin